MIRRYEIDQLENKIERLNKRIDDLESNAAEQNKQAKTVYKWISCLTNSLGPGVCIYNGEPTLSFNKSRIEQSDYFSSLREIIEPIAKASGVEWKSHSDVQTGYVEKLR